MRAQDNQNITPKKIFVQKFAKGFFFDILKCLLL